MKITAKTDTIRPRNEDGYETTKRGGFVLDGTSGLTKRKITPKGHDVSWMIKWWRKYLEMNLDKTEFTIHEMLKEGVSKFFREYNSYTNVRDLRKHELLSASVALARTNTRVIELKRTNDDGEEEIEKREINTFEVYVLGDAEVTIKLKNGNILTLTDKTIEYLEGDVLRLIKSSPNRKQYLTDTGFTEEEYELLKKNRELMNSPEGYYILNIDKNAVDNGMHKVMLLDTVDSCYIATDGIMPYFDRHSKSELLDSLRRYGVDSVIEEIRDIEKDYIEAGETRRIEEQDDITIIFMDFS